MQVGRILEIWKFQTQVPSKRLKFNDRKLCPATILYCNNFVSIDDSYKIVARRNFGTSAVWEIFRFKSSEIPKFDNTGILIAVPQRQFTFTQHLPNHGCQILEFRKFQTQTSSKRLKLQNCAQQQLLRH